MREIWTDTGGRRGRAAARSARGLTGRSLRCACASSLAFLFLGLGAAPALTLDPASLVKDIRPGSGNSFPSDLTNVAGTLFFGADDGTHRRELWKSDGTAAGTKLVKDIRPGAAFGAHPSYLTTGIAMVPALSVPAPRTARWSTSSSA
jgi:ELWxxDGT repeat protein